MKNNDFRIFLSDSLTLEQFAQYHNGNLVSMFYKKDARHSHVLPKSQEGTQILKLDIPPETKDKLIISYNAYKKFLKTQENCQFGL